jgi:hypothetical protein
MNKAVMHLVTEARGHVWSSYGDLGELTGASARTVRRWYAGTSSPHTSHLGRLADAVRSHDPAIAAALDVAAGRASPSSLPDEPAAALSRTTPRHILVDSIVCAAAEATALSPQAIRPALVAAFRRAEELGFSVGDVSGVLGATVATQR